MFEKIIWIIKSINYSVYYYIPPVKPVICLIKEMDFILNIESIGSEAKNMNKITSNKLWIKKLNLEKNLFTCLFSLKVWKINEDSSNIFNFGAFLSFPSKWNEPSK